MANIRGTGGFFKKSGNSRGFFPDTSIEEEKSLFTNDDERDSSCPCAIADGEITPPVEDPCETTPDTVLIPVTPEEVQSQDNTP